jgi:uncharacterized protein
MLKDKVVVVTGASQGLGRVLSAKIAAEGAYVALISRNIDRLNSLRSEIENQGGHAFVYGCDIRDPNQVDKTVVQIIKEHEYIDILINNAGVWTDDYLEKNQPEKRLNALTTNILGQIQFSEEVLDQMKRRGDGILFYVISTSGVPDIPSGNNSQWKSYGASKWGLTGYSQALREALRDTKIKVIQFFPGGFESNLYENAGRENPHNQPWMMKTEDVADIVLFTLTRPGDVYMEKLYFQR